MVAKITVSSRRRSARAGTSSFSTSRDNRVRDVLAVPVRFRGVTGVRVLSLPTCPTLVRSARRSAVRRASRRRMLETTLILKPDAVSAASWDDISRFEEKGPRSSAATGWISQQLAATHYEAHQSKPFTPA